MDGETMHRFNDNIGRAWEVTLNVAAIKRIRDLTGTNLLSVIEDSALCERLASDPVLLVDVLYAAVKPQADAIGVTDVQFGEAMAGDAIDAATDALLNELAAFFPLARRRLLAKLLEKIKALRSAAIAEATKRLDQIDENQVLRMLSDSATNAPESSA